MRQQHRAAQAFHRMGLWPRTQTLTPRAETYCAVTLSASQVPVALGGGKAPSAKASPEGPAAQHIPLLDMFHICHCPLPSSCSLPKFLSSEHAPQSTPLF